jgi:hypothetical protein
MTTHHILFVARRIFLFMANFVIKTSQLILNISISWASDDFAACS